MPVHANCLPELEVLLFMYMRTLFLLHVSLSFFPFVLLLVRR